jgi:hypothetical protein
VLCPGCHSGGGEGEGLPDRSGDSTHVFIFSCFHMVILLYLYVCTFLRFHAFMHSCFRVYTHVYDTAACASSLIFANTPACNCFAGDSGAMCLMPYPVLCSDHSYAKQRSALIQRQVVQKKPPGTLCIGEGACACMCAPCVCVPTWV